MAIVQPLDAVDLEIDNAVMEHVWTWGGTYFGYITDDRLFTHYGGYAGTIENDLVLDKDRRYLGELHQGRLITSRSRPRGEPHRSSTRGGRCGKMANYIGYVMVAGYEDFPPPEAFE